MLVSCFGGSVHPIAPHPLGLLSSSPLGSFHLRCDSTAYHQQYWKNYQLQLQLLLCLLLGRPVAGGRHTRLSPSADTRTQLIGSIWGACLRAAPAGGQPRRGHRLGLHRPVSGAVGHALGAGLKEQGLLKKTILRDLLGHTYALPATGETSAAAAQS